ncbi:Uu.00g018710.m01.CDS01 [Anthostomella pinea]|uniref:Uu.00g018710.m01.CDS01 n=1 Tax=Anthostomella pinea TaxID=933095 RepID=A0AAI8VZ59_9PEZI|nr:Uu.00g018710.m01.CDS01 [Anthostomella pinea]
MAPAKKRAAAANRASKPAETTTRRTSGRTTTAAAAKATKAKAPARKALAEKTNNIPETTAQGKGRGRKRPAAEELETPDTEEQDEIVSDAGAQPKGARGRPRATKAQKVSEPEDEPTELEPEPVAPPAAKRGRKPKTKVASPPAEKEIPETHQPEDEIPETQPTEELDLSMEEDELVDELPPTYNRGVSSLQRTRPPVPSSASQRPMQTKDSDLHDPSLRRRIGDLTKEHESLRAKYAQLHDIGINEAERNYDRLKKQGEEKASTGNQLIATLKAQLSTQTELAKESQQLRQQLEASQSKVEELQSKISDLNGSLTEAKAETKTLSTKLGAARTAASTSAKVPGSAIKGANANGRLVAANAEAAAQLALTKENLYGDLTGLLICGVKREHNEDVFDCVQTGRNTTLHFKLAIGVDGSSEKHDDAQFMYIPQLDPKNDQDLIDMLPDYLVEEITFPRLHAAKFYQRVMKTLTERPE